MLRAARTNASRAEAQIAVRIAAVLRIAAALGDTRIAGVHDDGATLDLVVAGGSAAHEHSRVALAQADLWNAVLPRPIAFVNIQATATAPRLLAPRDTVHAAGRMIVTRLFQSFFARHYGLWYPGDLEYVHELRVALRRLRAAMAIFSSVAPAPLAQVKTMSTQCVDALAAARDTDVFLEFLQAHAETAAPEQQPFLRAMVQAERRRRRRQYDALRTLFAGEHCTALTQTLVRALARAARDERRPQPRRAGAQRRVWIKAKRALIRRFRTVVSFPKDLYGCDAETQHRLRIACKKLRYTCEFFDGLYPASLDPVIKPMEELQRLLGDVHDCCLHAERAQAHYDRSTARAAGRAAGNALAALRWHLTHLREAALRDAQAAWQSFCKQKSRQHILALLKAPLKK